MTADEQLVRAIGEAILAEAKKWPVLPGDRYGARSAPMGATEDDLGRAAFAAVTAAGWRPPVCACEPFDVCLRCWGPEQQREAAIRQLAYCEASVQASADPEDGEQCTNLREPGSVHCAQHRPSPLPDSETQWGYRTPWGACVPHPSEASARTIVDGSYPHARVLVRREVTPWIEAQP
jgi:hypothetical protein